MFQGKECSQTCEKNCDDIKCQSDTCRPDCKGDNCKITCAGTHCYPKCHGKNCELNCKATNCEAWCIGGGCKVKFGRGNSGVMSCPGGNYTLVCATGRSCSINRCPTCDKPTYVDDPFKSSATNINSIKFLLLSIVTFILVTLLA